MFCSFQGLGSCFSPCYASLSQAVQATKPEPMTPRSRLGLQAELLKVPGSTQITTAASCLHPFVSCAGSVLEPGLAVREADIHKATEYMQACHNH